MSKIFNILFVAFVFLGLSQELKAATVPRKPNFEILFVKDIAKYQKQNPNVHLEAFNYHKNQGFTWGKEWNNILFNLEFKLDSVQDEAFTYEKSFSYAGDVTVDIQHVQIVDKSASSKGQVFLKSGAVGQSFVSVVVEVGPREEQHLTYNALVSGDVYDVIN